jgi:DNA-binding NtrC family response regulator
MSNQPDVASVSVIGRGASPYDQWLLGRTGAIRKIARHVERAAEVQCSVLIVGETGTGKELFARLLHSTGPRVDKPFVPVNCAALTATLAESQLFGHEKGAFTGAQGHSLGVFRAAEGGIVFLDEIGEMPLELQPKLLRVLQQREVTPVGASQPVIVDVQVIAATNRHLEADVQSGHFREDLYYRLNMVELQVPALRDRREDIPDFIDYFAAKFAERYDRPRWRPDPETLRQFCEFAWPGNIRQLSQVVEQGYVLDCPPALPRPAGSPVDNRDLPFTDLNRLRYVAVHQALKMTRGHKGRAARMLGVHPNTLTRILAQMTRDGELPSIEE